MGWRGGPDAAAPGPARSARSRAAARYALPVRRAARGGADHRLVRDSDGGCGVYLLGLRRQGFHYSRLLHCVDGQRLRVRGHHVHRQGSLPGHRYSVACHCRSGPGHPERRADPASRHYAVVYRHRLETVRPWRSQWALGLERGSAAVLDRRAGGVGEADVADEAREPACRAGRREAGPVVDGALGDADGLRRALHLLGHGGRRRDGIGLERGDGLGGGHPQRHRHDDLAHALEPDQRDRLPGAGARQEQH